MLWLNRVFLIKLFPDRRSLFFLRRLEIAFMFDFVLLLIDDIFDLLLLS